MKATSFILGLLIPFSTALRADQVPSAGEQPPPATKIVMNNQEFILIGKDESKAVKTYRYVTPGATSEDWTEMVSHQIIRIANRAGADEVLAFLREKSRGEVRMEGILETRKAAVFASLAPKTEKSESQLGVGLIFIDLSNSFDVHLISYTLKPNRLNAAEVEAKLRNWRDQFRARATALASS